MVSIRVINETKLSEALRINGYILSIAMFNEEPPKIDTQG